jgi:hypothetical protein
MQPTPYKGVGFFTSRGLSIDLKCNKKYEFLHLSHVAEQRVGGDLR